MSCLPVVARCPISRLFMLFETRHGRRLATARRYKAADKLLLPELEWIDGQHVNTTAPQRWAGPPTVAGHAAGVMVTWIPAQGPPTPAQPLSPFDGPLVWACVSACGSGPSDSEFRCRAAVHRGIQTARLSSVDEQSPCHQYGRKLGADDANDANPVEVCFVRLGVSGQP